MRAKASRASQPISASQAEASCAAASKRAASFAVQSGWGSAIEVMAPSLGRAESQSDRPPAILVALPRARSTKSGPDLFGLDALICASSDSPLLKKR